MTKILYIPSGEYVRFCPKKINHDTPTLNIEDSWFYSTSLNTLLNMLCDPCFSLNIQNEMNYNSDDRLLSEFEIIKDD